MLETEPKPKMKIHRNLALAIIAGLKRILIERNQADLTVSHLLQSNKSWGARDRNFIAENIYNIIRYKRLYAFCCNEETGEEPWIWKMLGMKLLLENFELPAWDEFSGLNREECLSRYKEAQSIRKIRESIPDWLDELGEKVLGENWETEIAALNTQAKLSIRVNTLKTDKNALQNILTAEGITSYDTELAPDALIIDTKKNLKRNAAYLNGLFEVQDVSSQLVAPMLTVEPGMYVIDGCAGAGGKTIHIAAAMKNEGKILAVDVNENKLKQLSIRAARSGTSIIETLMIEQLEAYFQRRSFILADRILLDVPCSGLGVLRRKPDAKWSMSLQFIEVLIKTQSQILERYAPLLKPGGILVYSTCSILAAENELQVRNFIKKNNGIFKLLEEKKVSASKTGFDGFYIAKLIKA